VTLERVDVEHCEDRLQIALHQARYDFVLERIRRDEHLLEIGVGAGTFTNQILSKCQSYVGVEYDRETCLEARRKTAGKANIIEGDARRLDFANDQFSFIACLEVLEHLGDFIAGVNEIHRCLKTTGIAIVSVPFRRIGGKSETNEHHPYEPGETELVSAFTTLFNRVEVYYQYFHETLWMTLTRKLHIRRYAGTHGIYSDLSKGHPNAISRLFIGTKARGLKLGLLLVVRDKINQ
jgi:SAM-dependent methyltransferase